MPNEAGEFVDHGGSHSNNPEEEEDQVDHASSDNRISVSGATQTDDRDGDTVDGSLLLTSNPLLAAQNNNLDHQDQPSYPCFTNITDGGFLSRVFTMVLPVRKKSSGCSYRNGGSSSKVSNCRTVATQTEEQDPICFRGQQLSYLIIQDLSLQIPVSSGLKDDVYESIVSCVCDMLVKHEILFNGMVRRCQVTSYHIFCRIANELFEVSSANDSSQMRITWGRIISLFAFAVRLAQEYHRDQERVDSIVNFLASYVTKHLITFVRANGGWEGLVEHFPPPVAEDAQIKRAILWSGLCVGLMATMYVSSFLSR